MKEQIAKLNNQISGLLKEKWNIDLVSAHTVPFREFSKENHVSTTYIVSLHFLAQNRLNDIRDIIGAVTRETFGTEYLVDTGYTFNKNPDILSIIYVMKNWSQVVEDPRYKDYMVQLVNIDEDTGRQVTRTQMVKAHSSQLAITESFKKNAPIKDLVSVTAFSINGYPKNYEWMGGIPMDDFHGWVKDVVATITDNTDTYDCDDNLELAKFLSDDQGKDFGIDFKYMYKVAKKLLVKSEEDYRNNFKYITEEANRLRKEAGE